MMSAEKVRDTSLIFQLLFRNDIQDEYGQINIELTKPSPLPTWNALRSKPAFVQD